MKTNVHDRRLTLGLSVVVAAAALMLATPAHAGGQATAANPPPALRPGKTNTVHEIGFSLNGAFNPDAFIPAFNWRFHLPSTGRIGQLSGLYMGFNIGPAVSFYGRGYGPGSYHRGRGRGRWDPDDRRYYDGWVWGRGGFELGYEIDPWSNLALTFSPVVHNDFYFSPWHFQFAQTFGPAIRLYINQHAIVYFEPGFLGWTVWTDGYGAGAWLAVRGGAGFAYKF
jgi:hypothetical protein